LHGGGDFQVLAAYRGRAGEKPDRGHVLFIERLVGSFVVLEYRVGQRFPQRLARRARQQRRADQHGPVGCQGADRLILTGEVVPECPGCHVRLSGDVLDGDVLQAPLKREPQRGRG